MKENYKIIRFKKTAQNNRKIDYYLLSFLLVFFIFMTSILFGEKRSYASEDINRLTPIGDIDFDYVRDDDISKIGTNVPFEYNTIIPAGKSYIYSYREDRMTEELTYKKDVEYS